MEIDLEGLTTVLGTLAKIVVLAMLLERALAFVFEFDWVARILTPAKTFTDRADTSPTTPSRAPGLKALIAFGLSWFVCHRFQVDAFGPLFNAETTTSSIFLTALIVAGGSSAAIALFQGVLGFGKLARDASVKAKEVDAEAQMRNAMAANMEADARMKQASVAASQARTLQEDEQRRLRGAP